MAVANRVLIAVMVPLSWTLPVPLVVRVTPAVVAALANTVTVPWSTPKVTVKVPVPPSTSATLNPLMTLAVSSAVVCATGTVLTGASLTALTVKATLPEPDLVPPEPVLPPSLTVTFKVSLPL